MTAKQESGQRKLGDLNGAWLRMWKITQVVYLILMPILAWMFNMIWDLSAFRSRTEGNRFTAGDALVMQTKFTDLVTANQVRFTTLTSDLQQGFSDIAMDMQQDFETRFAKLPPPDFVRRMEHVESNQQEFLKLMGDLRVSVATLSAQVQANTQKGKDP